MSNTLTITDIYDKKIDNYIYGFMLEYASNMETFSERYGLYIEGICSKDELFDTYLESGSNFINKIITTIEEFIDKMTNSIKNIFKKKKFSEIENVYKDSKFKTGSTECEINPDVLVNADKGLRDGILKNIRGVNEDNIDERTSSLAKLTKKYEEQKSKGFLKKAVAVSVSSLFAAFLYFKHVNSDSYKYHKFMKSELKKIKDGTHDIDDPLKQKRYIEYLNTVYRNIKCTESGQIPIISKIISSLEKNIHNTIDMMKGYKDFTKTVSKTVIHDEDRKKMHELNKKAAEESGKLHAELVNKYTKVIRSKDPRYNF